MFSKFKNLFKGTFMHKSSGANLQSKAITPRLTKAGVIALSSITPIDLLSFNAPQRKQVKPSRCRGVIKSRWGNLSAKKKAKRRNQVKKSK